MSSTPARGDQTAHEDAAQVAISLQESDEDGSATAKPKDDAQIKTALVEDLDVLALNDEEEGQLAGHAADGRLGETTGKLDESADSVEDTVSLPDDTPSLPVSDLRWSDRHF